MPGYQSITRALQGSLRLQKGLQPLKKPFHLEALEARTFSTQVRPNYRSWLRKHKDNPILLRFAERMIGDKFSEDLVPFFPIQTSEVNLLEKLLKIPVLNHEAKEAILLLSHDTREIMLQLMNGLKTYEFSLNDFFISADQNPLIGSSEMHGLLLKPLFKDDVLLLTKIVKEVKTEEHLGHVIKMYNALSSFVTFEALERLYRGDLQLAIRAPEMCKKFHESFYRTVSLCAKDKLPIYDLMCHPESAEPIANSHLFELLREGPAYAPYAHQALIEILRSLNKWSELHIVLDSVQTHCKHMFRLFDAETIQDIKESQRLHGIHEIANFISRLGTIKHDGFSFDQILRAAPFQQSFFECVRYGDGEAKTNEAILRLITDNLSHCKKIENIMSAYCRAYEIPVSHHAVHAVIAKELNAKQSDAKQSDAKQFHASLGGAAFRSTFLSKRQKIT
jgi:hypothetical protein